MAALDPEQPALTPLLAHTQEELASVKVFPLIPALKKDITVSFSVILHRALNHLSQGTIGQHSLLFLQGPYTENNYTQPISKCGIELGVNIF